MRFASLFLLLITVAGCGGPAAEASTGRRRRGRAPSASTLSVTGMRLGDPAPELELEDQDGRLRRLNEHTGHPVVVFFYPRNEADACTPDACAIRDAWDQFRARNVTVFGVSTDDGHSHRTYRALHQLPFDLLSDHDELAARTWGVPSEMGFITARQTYLIDGDGNVVEVWLNLSGVAELLTAIDQL